MAACSPNPTLPTAGRWEGRIALHDTVSLPLVLDLRVNEEKPTTASLFNHGETIEITDIQMYADSMVMNIPVFQSAFVLKPSTTRMEGHWHYPDKGQDYRLPLELWHVAAAKDEPTDAPTNLRFRTAFSPGTEDETPAVGEFTVAGQNITGTFLTETGDYRYLGGTLVDGRMTLSTFDGAHAFVFEAKALADGSYSGTFYSGNHFSEPFVMVPDDTFQLADPETLTTLKPGYETLAFSFPDPQGNPVSLTDDAFANQVVIVQILGSWCPNCMDETRFLTALYNDLHQQGLEIIGLAFERRRNPEEAIQAVEKMKTDLGAPYPFLVAGSSSKVEASEALPMLSGISSFPTTIVVDRSGKVRKIHTGFSGPGTQAYAAFSSSFRRFIVDLLNEDVTQNQDTAGTSSE